MNSSAEDVRPWHPLVPYAHPIRYPTRTGRAHERRGQEKSRADHHLGRRAMGKFSLRAASHPLFTKLGFFFFSLGLFWNPLLYRQQDVRGDHTTPSSQIQDVLNVKSYEWALVIWFLIIIL